MKHVLNITILSALLTSGCYHSYHPFPKGPDPVEIEMARIREQSAQRREEDEARKKAREKRVKEKRAEEARAQSLAAIRERPRFIQRAPTQEPTLEEQLVAHMTNGDHWFAMSKNDEGEVFQHLNLFFTEDRMALVSISPADHEIEFVDPGSWELVEGSLRPCGCEGLDGYDANIKITFDATPEDPELWTVRFSKLPKYSDALVMALSNTYGEDRTETFVLVE